MSRKSDRDSVERLVLTADEQRAADERAVAFGVPRVDLMESAGRSATEWILDRMAPSRVGILAGPGGNGGDGLVVARRLIEAGVDVETLLVASPDRLSGAPRAMLDRLRDVGGRVRCVEEAADSELDGALDAALVRANVVVDALFGSGLGRPLAGRYRAVVERVNARDARDARVVSLDLPSGLGSDRAAPIGVSVRADVTLAMAFLKPAHLLFPARGFCGNVAVVAVDYPPEALVGIEAWARVPDRAGIARRLPARPPTGHKGTFGRVLVVAGSVGMTGAAILCASAALRVGAGLVTLAAPASLDPILEAALPEAITLPLPDEDGRLSSCRDDRFARALERADVLAIGPGLGRADATAAAVRTVVSRFAGPVVLDADGIVAFRDHVDALAAIGGRVLATPHPGELGQLIGRGADEIDADRVEAARTFARARGLSLLLKGRPTAVALPDGTVWLNPTGNAGLATGGSGDVLTGCVAGFVAGGASIEDAAILAAYVHGWAAEVYARDRAERSLLPSDLIDLFPKVLREVETWS